MSKVVNFAISNCGPESYSSNCMTLAAISEKLGPPEVYGLQEQTLGPPEPGKVRLAIKAVGVSFADLLLASGKYQVVPPVPYIPGTECAGVVEEIGPGVDDIPPGTRVVAKAMGGLFAGAANLPRQAITPISDAIAFDKASVLTLSYATAWHALVDRGRLQRGESLLVLGSAGGTGYAAVQIGKYLGARVIASASSEEKLALALVAGADATVDTHSEAWRDDVKAANGGTGIDVVFDPVGGAVTDVAFRCLGWGGRHLVIGFVGGIPSLRTNLALLKGASLVGVDIRQFEIFEPDAFNANLTTILDLAARQIFVPAIAQCFPLTDFRSAMEAVAAGKSAGRIELLP